MEIKKFIDILDEDFELPSTHADLVDIIDASCEHYAEMPRGRKESRNYRNQLNWLIDKYNERRGVNIFVHVK